MNPLRRSTLVLSLAAAALAASPSLGHSQEAAKDAPKQAATEATQAGPIDAKAAAIYERGVQAVRAYRTIEMTSQTKIEGMEDMEGMAGMLPEGFDAKHRVLFRTNAADATPTQLGGALRIEQLDDAGVANFAVIDELAEAKAMLGDPRAKTYSALAGEDWPMVVGVKMIAVPNWFFEQRLRGRDDAQANYGFGASTMKSAAIAGVETLDGVECDVVNVVRELAMGSGEGMEGMEDLAAIPTIRMKETIAFARTDGLPRRITMMPEMDDMPEGADFPMPVTVLTGVKVDGEMDAALFATTAPEGFAKVDPPKPDFMMGGDEGGEPETPALKVKVGDAAPDFALKDLDGAEVTLASLKGKVVLLDFWATWCGPCKAAMPAIQKIADDYKDKGVVVLGINTWENSPDAARKYMADKKFTYPCLLAGDPLAEAYGVPGIPTIVVLGKDGSVEFLEVGMGGDGKIRAAIDAALAK
jgi:thiol-disulfide isomerase/thioredoxin